MDIFRAFFAYERKMDMTENILLLDGGMGRLLKEIGAPFRQPEWSALALMENPDDVKKAHYMFIDAGCDVITTNAYALVPFHIGEERFAKEGRALLSRAARLARETANEAERDIKVAGCIPPVFGSYRPDYFDDKKALELLYPIIEEQEEYVDVWLSETISSTVEARIIGQALKNSKKELWLSYTIKDREEENIPPQLRSGESIEQAVNAAEEIHASTMLFNCSKVEEMLPALAVAKESTNLRLGIYANAFGRIKEFS